MEPKSNQTYLKFSFRFGNTEIWEKMTRAKTQSKPSSEKIEKIFFFAPWRLGAKNFMEVFLLNI